MIDDTGTGFLAEPAPSPEVQQRYEGDVEQVGYVMNVSHLWAHQPALEDQLSELLASAADAASLTFRQRGVLVAAMASTLGDSYCSLAWGSRLAGEAGDEVAAAVLRGDYSMLDGRDQALAAWARVVTADPNAVLPVDLQPLRKVGYDDAQLVAITLFVGLRIAFSTVNDALGARPDQELVDAAPVGVRDAVGFGRPPASAEG